ncbi:MAG TPA: LysR family transcriptional regulator [Jatrophihabitans sp.]|nr:LysR family transcriptional regulator [Jatrophihabitans sp.]
MELADVEAFLVLAEELHFGRTAARTYVSPARVSQRIHDMEREIGGTLFERTSRRVTLTPLGDRLRAELAPAYEQLTAALATARTAARSPAGLLRLAFTSTTAGPPLDQLVVAFERAQPECTVSLHEVQIFDPLSGLRAGQVDVLVNWLVVDEPDLTVGPVIAEDARMLAVAVDHELASEPDVSVEVLADFPVPNWTLAPGSFRKAIVPERTPSGRQVLVHPTPVQTFAEGMSLVARGQAIHPTMASMISRLGDQIVLIPIRDMPPVPLGLIWCAAHENARIRSLAAVARDIVP